MMRASFVLALALPLLAGARADAATAESAEPTPSSRFALVIGANDGGPDRVKLRYATVDAEGFAQVMGTYGGIEPGHMLVVLDPDKAAVDAAFAELHARLGEAPGRTELLVFYSGHADEKGLLLGGERLPYAELRGHISAVPADVRIAIVDACASGALIRSKGGTRRPPFLVDQSSQVTGHAYLASASADEAAQESDRLQASFFSHALLTGLRGAADVTSDGVVTLQEAYQFAFQETLARTEGTRLGAQHASFDMQLVGSGDVVLTDLRQTGAGLLLADDVAGRVFVRDADGRLIAELQKPAGTPVRLGLAPGSYRMRLETTDGRSLTGAVALLDGSTTRVDGRGLTVSALEDTVARGDAPDERQPSRFERVMAALTDDEADPHSSTFGASLVPGVSTDGERAHREMSLNVIGGHSRSIGGVELGIGVNIVDEDVSSVQMVVGMNRVGGDVKGVQMAGAINTTGGDLEGVQMAGAFNRTGGRHEGVQLTGAVGMAGALKGVQFSGAASIAGPVEGVQLAGGVAIAEDVKGWQQASLLTVAEDVRGVQLAVVNVADHVKGVQLGLVNVADRVDGLSIALIPWIRDGRRHLELYSTELALLNIGGRLGGGGFHTLLSGGYQPLDERFVGTAGFGAEFVGELWSVDLDLLTTAVMSDLKWTVQPDYIASLRVLLGAQFAEHFGLFGGLSWNVAANPDPFDPGLFDPMVTIRVDWTLTLNMWPGFIAGVRF